MVADVDRWRAFITLANPESFPADRPEAPAIIALRDLLAEVEWQQADAAATQEQIERLSLRHGAFFSVVHKLAAADEQHLSLAEYRALRAQAQALLAGPPTTGTQSAAPGEEQP